MHRASARELVFATYLAPSIRPVYEFVVRAVASELECPARLITGQSFDELRSGAIDFAFLCGLPYVRLAREAARPVAALAAPVLEGERYGGSPVYFSDVVVRADDSACTFDQLRGRSWAYNEPNSHSGYLVTLFRLHQMGESGDFFGRRLMTGFHQVSITRVVEGAVDASAVDSQVLAVELRDHPELKTRLRIIDTLGPSTIQPLVAARHVPDAQRRDVLRVVARLAESPAGRVALDQGAVGRFVPVEDSRYDDIRRMLDAVESRGLTL